MLIEPRMRIGREQKQVIEAETQAISILSQVCTAHLRMHSCTMRAAYNISLNIAAVYLHWRRMLSTTMRCRSARIRRGPR